MVFFYDAPMQVKYFYDGIWSIGIAFQEFVIDFYSGRAINTSKILENAEDPDEVIIEWCEWEPWHFIY